MNVMLGYGYTKINKLANMTYDTRAVLTNGDAHADGNKAFYMNWPLFNENNHSCVREDMMTKVSIYMNRPNELTKVDYYMPSYCAKPMIIWDVGSKYGRTTADLDTMFRFTCKDLFQYNKVDETIKNGTA
jgi:hypothetical protein